ncbi:transglycosylase, partial [Pseudomonas syringae pv. actinidiae]|nr:transglycosylase [Pseudomonas syringae pv. actinidiae]
MVLLMMFSLKPWSRGLALALPLAVLLTACDKSDKPVTPPAAPHTTYTQASWEALPAVSEADLQ